MRHAFGVVLLFVLGSAQASLVDRGGGFIYDDVMDVTWLQDANYAQTSGYDADGKMTWDDSIAWADGLSIYDSVRDVTWDDWRLATTLQPDPSCSIIISDTFTYGLDCSGSEMGHLYNVDGVEGTSPGLFMNLQSSFYWSETEEFPSSDFAWGFSFNYGTQDVTNKVYGHYALAVRSGDVAASVVPIPAAVWLFGSGLGLLGWMRRKGFRHGTAQ